MEALERRGKSLAIAAIIFIVFCLNCKSVEAVRNSTKMSYVCPPQFLRLGHSCYYFSDTKSTWQNALFACKDRDSNLSVPARWEDRNLRNFLNSNNDKASRWIGGVYDYGARSWKWGGELRRMQYQSFSKMKKLTPEELQWHCIAMMPELIYRWAPRSCVEPRQYICQTKLRKLPKSNVEALKKTMGNINEITAPSVSREINDPRNNEAVTITPILNPKSFDLRPSPLRAWNRNPARRNPNRNHSKPYGSRRNDITKRSRPTEQRRLTSPFPGYKWNRRDPDGSFRYNKALLLSGTTGLSRQQVKSHLARLQHLRDKQISRRRRTRTRNQGDWLINDTRRTLAQTHARTYTVDNNISALYPKTVVEEFNMPLPQYPMSSAG